MIPARPQLHTETKGIRASDARESQAKQRVSPCPKFFYKEQDCPSNKGSKSANLQTHTTGI